MAGGWGVGSDEESSFGCRLKVRISTSLRSVRSSVLPLKDVHFILFPLLNYFIHFCNALTSIASLRHSLGPCVAAHPLKAPHISAYLAYSRCLFNGGMRLMLFGTVMMSVNSGVRCPSFESCATELCVRFSLRKRGNTVPTGGEG